jgi:hypothetical protein
MRRMTKERGSLEKDTVARVCRFKIEAIVAAWRENSLMMYGMEERA